MVIDGIPGSDVRGIFLLDKKHFCLVWRIKGKIFLFLAAEERANLYDAAYKKGY